MKRKILAMFLSLVMVFSLTCSAMAVSINDSSVFLRQSTNYTCTLTSAAMMLRRHAILSGNAGWSNITEGSVRPVAWTSGGLRNNFTYCGVSVGVSGDIRSASSREGYLISMLDSHPEGIVAFSGGHAVLLTDYDRGSGTFYCADPASGYSGGRMPLANSYIGGSGQSGKVASIRCVWYIISPPPVPPGPSSLSINLTSTPINVKQGNCFGLYGSVSSNYDITEVTGAVYNASGKAVLTSTDTPNSTYMNINSARLNQDLVFNKLAVGSYKLVITAYDSSGKSQSKEYPVTVTGKSGTIKSLNIRSGAGMSYEVKTKMPIGAKCKINPNKSTKNWYYVTYNGVSGYASKGYVKMDVTGTMTSSKYRNLYIHTSPTTSSGNRGTIGKGKTCSVDLSRSTQNWYYVTRNGVSGYCSKNHITLSYTGTVSSTKVS